MKLCLHAPAGWCCVTLAALLAAPTLADDAGNPEATGGLGASRPNSGVILREEGQLSLTHDIWVAAPIAGSVEALAVREGDAVRAGANLARLDTEIAEAELASARAGYEAARLRSLNDVDHQFATKSFDVRLRELQQSEQANERFAGSVTATEMSKLQLVVEQSRLAIEQAAHERRIAEAAADEKAAAIQVAEARLNKHRIEAPCDGMVAEIAMQAGEWVDAGRPMVRLISLDPIRVECFVDGQLHGPELLDCPVEFRLISEETSLDPTVHHGRVVFVSSELHAVTGQVRLWAELPNPDQKLRAGMRGWISVLAQPGE